MTAEFRVLPLEALVRVKLRAGRDKDVSIFGTLSRSG